MGSEQHSRSSRGGALQALAKGNGGTEEVEHAGVRPSKGSNDMRAASTDRPRDQKTWEQRARGMNRQSGKRARKYNNK
eukprot:scaffold48928_cov25-Tisochrysis_lutea.AAC.4